MKLKYFLLTACEITNIRHVIARYDVGIAVCKFLVAFGVSLIAAAIIIESLKS